MCIIRFLYTALLFCIGFASCSTSVSHNQQNPLLKRKWMLVEFNNFQKNTFTKYQSYLDFTTLKSKHVFGKIVCNNLIINIKILKNNTIWFSKIASTEMACTEGMDLENAFIKELTKMKKYSINGHFLTLSDENRNVIKFVAADWD